MNNLISLSAEQIMQFNDEINMSKIITGYIMSEITTNIYGKLEITTILYNLMINDLNKIKSQNFKDLSSEYIKRTEKLIKEYNPNNVVDNKKIIDYAFKGANITESVVKGATKTINRTNAIRELSDLLNNDKITINQYEIAKKVFDYYDFAQYILKEYEDIKTYNYIHKISKQTYKNISNKNIDTIIEKYVPIEFLKSR